MANPNTASFPYAPSTDVILAVASDNAQSTLSADVQTSDTSLSVADGSKFNVPCLVVVDGEIIRVKSKNTNTLTGCDRGFAGSTVSAHSSGTSVFGFVLSYHHNQLAAEIKSMSAFVFNSDLSGFKRTENLLSYSEAFDNVYWSKQSGAVATVSGTLLPNGSPSFTLTEGSSLGPNMTSAVPVGLTIAATYTFSVYAQYTNNQWIAVGQHIEGNEGNVAWFDVQNGVVGNIGSASSAAIVNVGNNWFRCLVVAPCTSNSYKSMDIALTTNNGTIDYVGTSTKTVLIAGAQVRSGGLDGPLSYVKTSGTTFSLTGSGDLILDEGDLS
jgi:hypothetical protein